MRQAASDGYYEEVREGQIIPAGSGSQPGTLIGVGPGPCNLSASLLGCHTKTWPEAKEGGIDAWGQVLFIYHVTLSATTNF
jgi:hypothetical protein